MLFSLLVSRDYSVFNFFFVLGSGGTIPCDQTFNAAMRTHVFVWTLEYKDMTSPRKMEPKDMKMNSLSYTFANASATSLLWVSDL